MNQAALFRCGQCRGDLLRNLDRGAAVERPRSTNVFLERLAFDQFHRVKALSCLLANSELEHGGNVLVSQRSCCASFTDKTLTGSSASPGDSDRNDLQRHLALERPIDGAIRHAHRSVPKLVKTSVLPALNLVNSKMRVAFESVQG
jgi:hypothetical protein